MKKLFATKTEVVREGYSLGIDIGTSFVKAVKLKRSKEKTELCSFLLEPIQIDLTAILKKLTEGPASRFTTLSVSGASSIIRYINFLKMNADELKNALKFEAQKYIPFALADVNIDSCILKPDLADNKMLVLLAAVKKDYLSVRLKSVADSGIKVNTVDLDSLALVNSFIYNYPQAGPVEHQAAALINIGHSVTNLNIIEGQIPQLSRDINIAGKNFTQKIVEILELDNNAAEQLKLNPDKDRMTKVIQIMESVLSVLAAELRTSFDYYESQSASSVKKIYLSGGTSLFPGLNGMLSGLLDVEVVCWDPFAQVAMQKDIDIAKIKDAGGQFAVALGLALRG
ncbi:MAG: type IV pilus assembly protein PilM [Candidatus Omnitrophota bacterium]